MSPYSGRPEDDEPRPEHDDGLCVDALCPREALVLVGKRTAYCQEHLDKYAMYVRDGALSLATLQQRPNVVSSNRLNLRERAWLPTGGLQMAQEWPIVTKVEMFSGCAVHQNDGDDDWTWRSVAMAARAYPDRVVRLVGNTLYVPHRPADRQVQR